ncbi:MAG: hypothetical protein DDT32_01510 [Syntrophomonadaceae bacterium]|nr:hypothetical protein [Bacillota bacterium]
MFWEIADVITSIAVAIATAAMAWTTFKLGKETKRAIDESRKREAEQAFQSLFMSLREDIKTYDDLCVRYRYGDLAPKDFSDVEAIKTLLSCLTEVNPCSFSKIDSLLEKVLLDGKLLQLIQRIKSSIDDSFRHIKQFHQTIERFFNKDGIINQTIPTHIINICFRLRQLACYFMCEAERLGHKELAGTMREIPEFEPDITMQRLQDFQELDTSLELDGCYALCSTKSLVERAVDRTREEAEHMLRKIQEAYTKPRGGA